MEYRSHRRADASEIESLFVSVFTASEGSPEGVLIGKLARDLMIETDAVDVFGYVAVDEGQVIGSIFFSRLTFEIDLDAFILSPVAIHIDHQGLGIGQGLINYGLHDLKGKGVELVMTYGDPNYYSKVGFQPVSEKVVGAPLDLSQPEGWQGQSNGGDSVLPVPGRCSCVRALNNPVYW